MSQAVLSPEHVTVSANGIYPAFVVRTRPAEPGAEVRGDMPDGVYVGRLDGRPWHIDGRVPVAGPAWDPSGTRLAFAVDDEKGEQHSRIVVRSVPAVSGRADLAVDGVVERLRWGTGWHHSPRGSRRS